MLRFKMLWPELAMAVRCEGIEKNKEALEIFMKNMPLAAIQGHEMVGGWMLRNRCVFMEKAFFDIPASALEGERMDEAPVGRISLLFPQGNMTEMVIKYDECDDFRKYVPIARVVNEDQEILKKVGKLQWKSATRTKEIIKVEFVAED